jgi:hypothetical protein
MAHLTHDIEFPPLQDPIRRRASRILHPSPLGCSVGAGGFVASSSNQEFNNPPVGINGHAEVNSQFSLLIKVLFFLNDDGTRTSCSDYDLCDICKDLVRPR